MRLRESKLIDLGGRFLGYNRASTETNNRSAFIV
jgi:hypothetical protein